MTFKDVESRYNGPKIEQEILAFWDEDNTFEKSIEQGQGKPRFSFCEGPPDRQWPAGYSSCAGTYI